MTRKSSTPPAIVWFRRDLRLADNPALNAAAQSGRPVIPLYILEDPAPDRPMGAASLWWLDKSLRALRAALARTGSPLVLRRGEARRTILQLIDETGARSVYWNRLYDPGAVERDKALAAALEGAGLERRSFNAALLNEPWEVATGAGGPFKVFSAYWRAAAPRAGEHAPLPAPASLTPPESAPASEQLEAWRLHPTQPDWSGGFCEWRPGEAGASERLEAFLRGEGVRRYDDDRDRPDLDNTSRLSPHLHFGEISPRQVWSAAQAAMHEGAPRRPLETFLKEIGWREFNHQLLFHFPHTIGDNLNAKFDAFPWRDDTPALDAWRRGRTGYPIVDAGMRQLWSLGWMHNRVRMIVASFLVKDLLIDWRVGEAWFWDTLVDADLANNVGGWQWTAGSGADAAPYFRVFNPILQGVKFDPHGDYVRRWVPELAHLPDAAIHSPWTAEARALEAAGVRLGETYPRPIVDHADARDRALALYEALP